MAWNGRSSTILGVRPDIPQGEVSVIPSLPPTWPTLSAAKFANWSFLFECFYDAQRESLYDGGKRAVWPPNPHRLRFARKKHSGRSNSQRPARLLPDQRYASRARSNRDH
jgi:hypothetical protein